MKITAIGAVTPVLLVEPALLAQHRLEEGSA